MAPTKETNKEAQQLVGIMDAKVTIDRLAFFKVFEQIVESSGGGMAWDTQAVVALQVAAESFILDIMKLMDEKAEEDGRFTLIGQDMDQVREILRRWVLLVTQPNLVVDRDEAIQLDKVMKIIRPHVG